MSRLVVTEADLAKADRLLEQVKKKDRKELGKLFAEIREEALQCALVRVERMFDVTDRKQPGLPFDEASMLKRETT